jgi:hypothetical protein
MSDALPLLRNEALLIAIVGGVFGSLATLAGTIVIESFRAWRRGFARRVLANRELHGRLPVLLSEAREACDAALVALRGHGEPKPVEPAKPANPVAPKAEL